jgi:hypothetical protein
VDPTVGTLVGTAFFIGNVGDDLTLVYNYTPNTTAVPELPSLALLATALGAIIVVIKRKAVVDVVKSSKPL